MNNLIAEYTNGNGQIKLFSDGTKEREWPDETIYQAEFPESMDIKVTNKCLIGCAYCHEESSPLGKHASLYDMKQVLETFPVKKGIDLAIGGGNPLNWFEFVPFIKWASEQGFVCNVTVNEKQLLNDYGKSDVEDLLFFVKQNWIKGIGVSVHTGQGLYKLHPRENHIVAHIIIGLKTRQKIAELSNACPRILLLGYKQHGRGLDYYRDNKESIDQNIAELKEGIKFTVFAPNTILAFDNLAIEQLDLKAQIPKKDWDSLYMGDEGQASMYIDFVQKQFALNSRSVIMYDIPSNGNIVEMFKGLK